MKITIPSRLSDAEIVAEVSRCACTERGATAQLVAHLAEFDARRLHLAAGYSSLFAYCCQVLGLSEHGTYNRIEAARAARRFPAILERLADGSLNVTTVRLLAPHLTGDNHEELLGAAARRSKREVEELVARLSPRPDTPSSVRKVPERRPASPAPQPAAFAGSVPASVTSAATSLLAPPPVPPPSSTSAQRPRMSPLAAERYEIRFTAGAATRDKLKLAQDLLRHAVPNGDPAEIFDRALTALIDELSRRKLAVVRKPRRAPRRTKAGSRHIPAPVKRAVWARDGGCCAFVASGGHRCAERAFLEYHHVIPYGAGGEATVDNIQLRCRAHNGYEADVFYGPGRSRGGAGVVSESRPNHAISWVLDSFRGELLERASARELKSTGRDEHA
jgi:hypothetical protein